MIQNFFKKYIISALVAMVLIFGFAQNATADTHDVVNQPIDVVQSGSIWCAGGDCYESESSCKSSEIDFLCTQTANTQMYCNVGYSGPASSANCYNSLDKCTDGIGWSSRDCVAVANTQELDEKKKVYEGVKLSQNAANATIDEIKALIEQEPATAEQKQAIQAQIDQKLTNMDNSVKNMQNGVMVLSSGGAQLNSLRDGTVDLQGNINSLNNDLRAWTANQSGGVQPGGAQPGGGQVGQVQTIADRIESAQATMEAAGLPGGKPGEMVYIPLESMFITQTDTNLPNFLKFVFNTGVAIAGVSALVMLVIGGIMYVGSAGNQATATSAKGVIRDALLGVVMVFFTWLLLFVINPDLISIDDNLAKLTEGAKLKQLKAGDKATGVVRVPTDGGGGVVQSGGVMDPMEQERELGERKVLTDEGIAVWESGQWKTNIRDLPAKSINTIKQINQAVGGVGVQVNGGAEKVGHSTATKHGPGANVYDLQSTAQMTKYMNDNGSVTGKTSGGYDIITITSGPLQGSQVLDENGHYHVNMD